MLRNQVRHLRLRIIRKNINQINSVESKHLLMKNDTFIKEIFIEEARVRDWFAVDGAG